MAAPTQFCLLSCFRDMLPFKLPCVNFYGTFCSLAEDPGSFYDVNNPFSSLSLASAFQKGEAKGKVQLGE